MMTGWQEARRWGNGGRELGMIRTGGESQGRRWREMSSREG